MAAAIICREMGWTWQEYQNAPTDFIEVLVGLFKAENNQRQKKT